MSIQGKPTMATPAQNMKSMMRTVSTQLIRVSSILCPAAPHHYTAPPGVTCDPPASLAMTSTPILPMRMVAAQLVVR